MQTEYFISNFLFTTAAVSLYLNLLRAVLSHCVRSAAGSFQRDLVDFIYRIDLKCWRLVQQPQRNNYVFVFQTEAPPLCSVSRAVLPWHVGAGASKSKWELSVHTSSAFPTSVNPGKQPYFTTSPDKWETMMSQTFTKPRFRGSSVLAPADTKDECSSWRVDNRGT